MRSSSRLISRAAAAVAKVVSMLAASGLVLMTGVIGWQVFARYVLNDSPSWSESAALIIMLYFVLLAAAVGVYQQFHLGFRLFVGMLPVRLKRIVFILGQTLVVLFGVTMASNGMALVDFTSSHIVPALGIPRSAAYWPFPVCGVLIALFALVHIVTATSSNAEDDPWT